MSLATLSPLARRNAAAAAGRGDNSSSGAAGVGPVRTSFRPAGTPTTVAADDNAVEQAATNGSSWRPLAHSTEQQQQHRHHQEALMQPGSLEQGAEAQLQSMSLSLHPAMESPPDIAEVVETVGPRNNTAEAATSSPSRQASVRRARVSEQH